MPSLGALGRRGKNYLLTNMLKKIPFRLSYRNLKKKSKKNFKNIQVKTFLIGLILNFFLTSDDNDFSWKLKLKKRNKKVFWQ